MRIGYLRQFAKKFGWIPGLKLYFNISFNKISKIQLPTIEHPICLRENSSDLKVFYQIFLNDEYSINIPFTPTVIIDGESNIGLFSVLYKNLFKDAKLICIEPDYENFILSEENLSNYENVFHENKGIWTKDTSLRVSDKHNSGKWGMVVEEDPRGELEAITIDSIIRKYAINIIDVLKLDIESTEKYIFNSNYENWLPKVKMIIIELHDWMEPGCSRPFFEAINKCFTNYEYSCVGENTIIINLDLKDI